MAMNEAFITSATVRDNIINIAKTLNYTPRSITASKACVNLKVQTSLNNGVYPSSLTLRKGAVATGGNFVWNVLQDFTVNVNSTTGIAEFNNLLIYEGAIINFSYTVNTFSSQIYKVPSSTADISTLRVTVKANESSTTSDTYSLVETVTNLSATERVYFLSEGEDMQYEVTFGDDSLGRSLKDGEVVNFEYLTTSGPEANGVNVFSVIGFSATPLPLPPVILTEITLSNPMSWGSTKTSCIDPLKTGLAYAVTPVPEAVIDTRGGFTTS